MTISPSLAEPGGGRFAIGGRPAKWRHRRACRGGETREPVPPMPAPGADLHLLVDAHHLHPGAIALRSTVLRAHGRFDSALRCGPDSDLLTGLAAAPTVIGLDIVGSVYRQRTPTRRDAEISWNSHRLSVKSNKKLRGLGALPPWRLHTLHELRTLGLTARYFCGDARVALPEHLNPALAARVSPLHASLKPNCWRTLGSACATTYGRPNRA